MECSLANTLPVCMFIFTIVSSNLSERQVNRSTSLKRCHYCQKYAMNNKQYNSCITRNTCTARYPKAPGIDLTLNEAQKFSRDFLPTLEKGDDKRLERSPSEKVTKYKVLIHPKANHIRIPPTVPSITIPNF